MTPKQADKLIASGAPAAVRNVRFGEQFSRVFVKRDRWNIYSKDGGKFDRGELEIICSCGDSACESCGSV